MQDGGWQANEKKSTVLGHMISEWDQSKGRHYFHLLLEQEKELTPAQIA
jgi:hypothetical protein